MLIPIMETAGWYMKEPMKYPPEFKIGVPLNNNPPMHNLAPEAKKMMQKNLEERGLGRPSP